VTTESPAKKVQTKELETPPPSPSKVPLPSPSKTNYRIPPSPHRESSDEFWSQEVTNSWNDQWSPQKPRTPGRALQRLLVALGGDVDDDEETSRPASPTEQKAQKSPSKTALKKAEIARKKEIMAQKKAFDDKKASLGEDFLRALDDAVCDGQVQKMTECTGGIKTIWSKTLQTTAGRANWKQEKITKPGQPTRFVHHASIELAERIIDSEDRLLNTLAHEYCHLANFIISKVKTNPHGASFKEWGRKCTEAVRRHPIYKHYPVAVSTKHSYKIDYKYVWLCVDCGKDYGRHSKSIDPSKSKCGVCKGILQQIKPKPRNVSPKKSPCYEAGQKDIDDVTRAVGRVSLAPV
jgi:predicted SprT family Zn-dependent metalloprotease